MTSLRLLADDLTGALDTAAEFVGLCGPFDVIWAEATPSTLPSCLAIDSGTRERSLADSVAVVERLAPLLGGAGIAYKKVDSLLRGAWAAELAATLRAGSWKACIVAPAFTYQGRRTRRGQQYALGQDGRWSPVGDTLLAQLAAEGVEARTGRRDAPLTEGIHVFDAETDADLERVVAIGRSAPFPVLWCGSGGLAGALTRGHSAVASQALRAPVLGLFGSDQRATAAQLDACGHAVVTLKDENTDNAGIVRRKLAHDRVAMVRFDLAPGLSRGEAAQRIARELTSLTSALDPPGALIVAGGETLKAACLALGASALKVTGRIVPGLPRSLLQGGRWDGVEVISKSGAFGAPDLWRHLLQENQLLIERHAS
ncbi:four-carbon acid sugar kinase family protein [Bradyrhizobium sp. CB1650]|uniref:four-carbon acid sugar kinase family protein n=1 Tax=Bradyrhizobium sp. CB1650 TaxID=3039153 RepID=UPI002435A251|nr:four-carbon acid sugar kinase family protein [Bradyrhizobium sp. CB1650]WGD55882.1 four-carbon acid sugar kinase family protein [Bradyrhizobium sp. CB1650]